MAECHQGEPEVAHPRAAFGLLTVIPGWPLNTTTPFLLPTYRTVGEAIKASRRAPRDANGFIMLLSRLEPSTEAMPGTKNGA